MVVENQERVEIASYSTLESNRRCTWKCSDFLVWISRGLFGDLSQPHLTSVNFIFVGILMGVAIRTGSPLSLSLAEPVWKQLAGMPLTLLDLAEVDRDYLPGMLTQTNWLLFFIHGFYDHLILSYTRRTSLHSRLWWRWEEFIVPGYAILDTFSCWAWSATVNPIQKDYIWK